MGPGPSRYGDVINYRAQGRLRVSPPPPPRPRRDQPLRLSSDRPLQTERKEWPWNSVRGGVEPGGATSTITDACGAPGSAARLAAPDPSAWGCGRGGGPARRPAGGGFRVGPRGGGPTPTASRPGPPRGSHVQVADLAAGCTVGDSGSDLAHRVRRLRPDAEGRLGARRAAIHRPDHHVASTFQGECWPRDAPRVVPARPGAAAQGPSARAAEAGSGSSSADTPTGPPRRSHVPGQVLAAGCAAGGAGPTWRRCPGAFGPGGGRWLGLVGRRHLGRTATWQPRTGRRPGRGLHRGRLRLRPGSPGPATAPGHRRLARSSSSGDTSTGPPRGIHVPG